MILFRCNVGPDVGLGHLTRCRTLAAVLRADGAPCVMAGPADSYRIAGDETLFDDWFALDWTSPEVDAEAFVDIARKTGARFAVMDDYRISEPYQLRLRAEGLPWLQQFDASRPPAFWADFVANGGPYEKAEHYAELTRNPRTEFLLGPEYAVLRPAFTAPAVRPADRPVRQVLVSFGGGDDKGVVIAALSALLAEGPEGVRYRVMSGAHNPGNDAILAWAATSGQGRVTVSINPADVLAEYLSCDLAVLAGGTSTFEAAATGLPMFLTALADNQIRQCMGWEERGAALYLGRAGGVDFDALAREVSALTADDGRRISMSTAGCRNVDGRGGQRLSDKILGARR